MADGKFFATTKKGEIFEIKADLNSENAQKRKEAIKKVIASMTVGKDVSSLFPDVLKNMQTDNLEQKKLVYLYLMNYAKTQPELCILAVNTFVKDSEDNNPLIRALAIRTMGCIRVDKIIDYICQPLAKCLKDPDPYVRKTAVIGVAKLYDINPSLCEMNGFFEELSEMLSDSNPMVVSNAVAAMSEIMEDAGGNKFLQSPGVLQKLLAALNECNEWGQIFILDGLVSYKPTESREAEAIAERVIPRLTHANPSVVLSSVRVLLNLLNFITNPEFSKTLYKKMGPPLVTLLSTEPEVQYVALRNINLILRKYPDILTQEMRVFFCKYNDPIYIKLEKLGIIVKLASEKNIDQVLNELKEYATEVDVEFVRKAVRAIGRCAIKLDAAAERCINTLLDLIKTKVNYVVQESIIVIKDIFRKYPNKYENLIPLLCENLEELDEPEAKASMVWIIGEYAERIQNAGDLLTSFLETFEEDTPTVQLQLLTAIVKLFLKRPSDAQDLVQQVLQLATTKSDNADLRDRGYVYWRLLSSDPNVTKAVVLAEKPPITIDTTDGFSGSLLDELIDNIGTLASVYHKPSSAFLAHGKIAPAIVDTAPRNLNEITEELVQKTADTYSQNIMSNSDNLLDLDLDLGGSSDYARQGQQQSYTSGGYNANSLLDLLDDTPPQTQNQVQSSGQFGGLQDLVGLSSSNNSASGPMVLPKQTWLNPQQGNGMEIQGTFARRSGTIYMDFTFINSSNSPLSDFAIQFNKNSFGLVPSSPLQVQTPLMPHQRYETSLALSNTGQKMKMSPLNVLQVAVKNNIQVFYFQTLIPLHVLLSEDGRLDQNEFLQAWQSIPTEQTGMISDLHGFSAVGGFVTKMIANNIVIINQRKNNNIDSLFVSMKVMSMFPILGEILIHPSFTSIKLTLKTQTPEIIPLFIQALESILKA